MREKEFLPLVASRLGIEALNPMQERMMRSSSEARDIILLSPTGSGKTLAFALPMLKWLRPAAGRLQAVVIAPSRELVIQIGGVLREITPGYKVSVLYGGHNVEDEVNTLSVAPDIIVATPGRLLDHLKRGNIDPETCRILVLDEFDKSLELGFEEDMRKIRNRLRNVSRTILTSATPAASLPAFLKLDNPQEINFLPKDAARTRKRMQVYGVRSQGNDKLEALLDLLRSESVRTDSDGKEETERTIIFVNHRESAERVYEFLRKNGVDAALYHGALDQRGREQALISFNNGSRPILVATDLAARGLDIEGVRNIVHYHQPLTPEAYTHRNGRTARVDNDGEIYLLLGPEEELKEYVDMDREISIRPSEGRNLKGLFGTVVFDAGRKEKMSRGDILGFLVKDCGVTPENVGKIHLFDHYALAAVARPDLTLVEANAAKAKVKGKRVRVSLLKE
ncbi:MAG: DEAD/DEAH box helicase [Bacteroides sp.]|nr:DEAD/DEAH box helicase [Bacteroides sp.]